ncbi:aspartate 1-decarboxylase [Alphaproteobacteria bacterium]|nr:aspartate 1-decarboxylase [Alphaproteobacteria bacterium]
MQITVMRAKIHRAIVTQADLNYEGSISIDQDLLRKSGIIENEKVDVLNINNGERFTTYAILAKEHSREIKINGAAARKVQVGDPVIIIAYGSMDIELAKKFQPKIIKLDEKNNIA